MRKLFLKEYKTHVARYSYKYWFAVVVELLAIILWTIGLLEIYILKKTNPADLLLQVGGLIFVIGSFLYAKWVQH
jgi:hypothetical protein